MGPAFLGPSALAVIRPFDHDEGVALRRILDRRNEGSPRSCYVTGHGGRAQVTLGSQLEAYPPVPRAPAVFCSIGADSCESETHEACRAVVDVLLGLGTVLSAAPRILVPHYARSSGEGPGIQCVGGLALDRLLVDHASGLHFELLLDPAVRSRRRRVVKGSGDLR